MQGIHGIHPPLLAAPAAPAPAGAPALRLGNHSLAYWGQGVKLGLSSLSNALFPRTGMIPAAAPGAAGVPGRWQGRLGIVESVIRPLRANPRMEVVAGCFLAMLGRGIYDTVHSVGTGGQLVYPFSQTRPPLFDQLCQRGTMNQGVCFSLTRYWMDSLRTGTTNQFFFDLTQPDSSTVTNVVDAQAGYLDGFDDLNAVPPLPFAAAPAALAATTDYPAFAHAFVQELSQRAAAGPVFADMRLEGTGAHAVGIRYEAGRPPGQDTLDFFDPNCGHFSLTAPPGQMGQRFADFLDNYMQKTSYCFALKNVSCDGFIQ